MRDGVSEVWSEKLVRDLSDLGTRGDDELKERWRQLYGTEPLRKVHHSLVVAAIAHRMQINALGGLKASVHRHLMHVFRDAADGREALGAPIFSPQPGTVLVRDWGGVTHQVRVLEDGLLFRGK
jgi:hypothetical protein